MLLWFFQGTPCWFSASSAEENSAPTAGSSEAGPVVEMMERWRCEAIFFLFLLYLLYPTVRVYVPIIAGWWQLKYFFFHPEKLGKMNPFWLIFFKWVETTNAFCFFCTLFWESIYAICILDLVLGNLLAYELFANQKCRSFWYTPHMFFHILEMAMFGKKSPLFQSIIFWV